MLIEIMEERESTPVLIKPSVQMNFNEDHFYSRASTNGLPEQPSALLQPPVKSQNLPQSPPSVNMPAPDLESQPT
jgi:hypothetical protein